MRGEFPETTKSVKVDGAELAYVEKGTGDPVVFVHGAISDLRAWKHQLEDLGSTNRAIAYSCRFARPNRGIAEGQNNPFQTHVEDLAALLEALGATPSHLVGNSSGAFICMLLALQYPHHVSSLVLEEPPALSMYVSTPPKLPELLSLFLSHPLTALGIVQFGLGVMERTRRAFLRNDDETAIRAFVRGVLGNQSFDELSAERQGQIRDNYKWLKALLLSGDTFPPIRASDLGKLAKPVLLITGENSPPFFTRMADRIEELLPRVERARIPGASHLMHEEKPNETNSVIREFLVRIFSTTEPRQ